MARIYEAKGWKEYIMDWRDPYRQLEPLETEIEVVDDALSTLVEVGILTHSCYDKDKMLAFRDAVRKHFDIPWTAINPRMQRLLYSINAIARPGIMVAVGIFCGNTFISNAGAAIGPGACYDARRLIGLEILPEEAERARLNVSKIDDDGIAEIIAADGVPWLGSFEDAIDLLYLDADGAGGRGKSIYLDLVRAAEHSLRRGSLVLAHNSQNSARALSDYLEHVRNVANFRESINVVVDNQGLEVSVR